MFQLKTIKLLLFIETIIMTLDEPNKNSIIVSSNESIKLKENDNLQLNIIENKDINNIKEYDDLNSSLKLKNITEREENKFEKFMINKDDFLLKNMTNNPFSLDIYRKHMQKSNEEDEIDVENYSDDYSTDNENKINENLLILKKTIISKSRTPSSSSSRSTSSTYSSRSSSSSSRSNNSSKFNSDCNDTSSKKDYVKQLANDQNAIIKKDGNINKNRRQRFHSNYNTALQKQNTTSILINGKRYYQLKFSCENCGLRYSDQGTLNMHKLNYCTKRTQSNDEQDRSKQRSRGNSESKNSRSNSPQSNKNPIEKNEKETNNEREEKESNQKNSEMIEDEKNLNDINQIKNVIYQCNSCLFQTDKKSIMNKHSRVHLPQKRKAMEESTLQNNNNNSLSDSSEKFLTENNQSLQNLVTNYLSDKQNDDTLNEKTNSYCKDCDIQFSSMKTYLHHRNIYCQKYKTIELSPNEARQQTLISLNPNKAPKSIQMSKNDEETKAYMSEDDKININKKNEIINKLSVNKTKIQDEPTFSPVSIQSIPSSSSNIKIPPIPSSISSFSIQKQQLVNPKNSSNNPPNAVCMGDLVYLPVYKINKNNDPSNETNLNMPIQVPIQIPSKLPYNTTIFQANRFSNSLDPKLLDTRKIETLSNWNKINDIKRNSEIEENLFKRKRSSSNSSDRSLKIDDDDYEEENYQDNVEDSPLDLSIKNSKIMKIKQQNHNDELIHKSQRLINDAFLNGLISPIENDSIKNYLHKKQKTNLNNEIFLRNNSIYYSELMKNYPFNLIQEQTNVKAASNMEISSQQSLQNFKFENALIELANYQKNSYTSHLNKKKNLENYSDIPPDLNRLNFQIPVLNQNNPISSLSLNENDKLFKCNYCKDLIKMDKVKSHKCIVIQNILKQPASNLNNKEHRSSQNMDSISSCASTLQSTQFSKLLASMVLNPKIIRKYLDEECKETIDDNNNRIESIHARSSGLENNINYNNEQNNEELEELLKHPLVKKTLSETYGGSDIQKLFSFKQSINEDDININNRHFFICTNCGYRGNTSRGVKQHGKMHINNNEHFAIINATDKFPLVVYNSKHDCDIKILNKAQEKTELIDYVNDDENNKIKYSESDLKELKQDFIESSDSNFLKMQSLTSDLKSDTYCFKCGIQFQHIKNFLAHKKSYCNDN
jgi:hypothetical protein